MSAPYNLESIDPLLDRAIEDAESLVRREEDASQARARTLRAAALDHVESLTRAAKQLGAVRGRAAEASLQAEAEREIEGVHTGAMDALFERFERRVVLALKHLTDDEAAYGRALAAWSRHAAAAMLRPTEVRCRRRDKVRVYEALLAAGAEDFHVVGEPRIHGGFLVLDLDGRTVFDAQPEALVETHKQALRTQLEQAIDPFEMPG